MHTTMLLDRHGERVAAYETLTGAELAVDHLRAFGDDPGDVMIVPADVSPAAAVIGRTRWHRRRDRRDDRCRHVPRCRRSPVGPHRTVRRLAGDPDPRRHRGRGVHRCRHRRPRPTHGRQPWPARGHHASGALRGALHTSDRRGAAHAGALVEPVGPTSVRLTTDLNGQERCRATIGSTRASRRGRQASRRTDRRCP